MAIIAELCGIPGAGKSTIYHTLKSTWKSHYPWIPFHKVLPKTDINSNSAKQLFITLAKKTLNLPNVNEMEEAGMRFISTHPEYINFFWKALDTNESKSFNGTDQRFEKAKYVYNLIQKIQIARESTMTKTIVVDEGLINAIGSFIDKNKSENEIKEMVPAIIKTTPIPEALIYLEADTNEIFKRLKNRSKKITSFRNVNNEDLINILMHLKLIREIAVDCLKDMRVPVLKINSADSVEDNCHKIIPFISKLTFA